MKLFTGFLSDIWNRIKETFSSLYSSGIGDLVSNRRVLKSFIDIALGFCWFVCLSTYGTSVYTAILGVAVIMAVMSRTFNIEGESFTADILNPFITMLLYAISAFLFFWAIETALIIGLLIIPNVSNEVLTKYHQYMEETQDEHLEKKIVS